MMQRIYWYVTAVMAAKFGIQLHAVQVLSTHIHEVLTDVHGLLPAFLRERNRIFANVLKVHRGWPEEVFQRAPASCVKLHGADTIAKKIGYTLANCVEAGLVRHPEQWPGVTVSVDDIGQRVVETERPPMYFDPENPVWPATAKLAITMPQALVDVYGPRARDFLRRVVQSAVESARVAARQARRIVSGSIAKLCTLPITRRSSSREAFGGRNPTFAAGGDRARAKEALLEREAFLSLYRQALDAVKQGLTDVPFPEGTWRWVRELLPKLRKPPHVVA